MARRSHRKGHGTGTRDYNLLAEVNAMPRRDSLPGGNAGTVVEPRVYGSGVPGVSVEDRRSDELKFWDEHYEDLKKRMAANRTADRAKAAQAKREVAALKKRVAKATALGVPLADDAVAKNQTEQTEPTKTAEGTSTTTATTTSGAPVNPNPESGTRQKKEEVSQAKPAPLNPKRIAATIDVSTRNIGGGDAAADTQIDGLSDRNQTDVVSHLNGAVRSKAAILDIQANDARKDALQASKVNDEIRRRQSIREAAEREENGKDYWQARADRLKAERAERNYKNRTVNSASDWENLGRLRGNELDGKALSDEDYNKTVADLQERAARLRTAERRAGLTDSDLRDMSGFFKTVGKVTVDKETGAVTHANGKKFTPAQIEALSNRISKYEGIAKERQSATQAKVEAHQRQRMFDLREKYGLGDSRVFSDEDVERVHKERTGQQVKAALGETLDAFINRDKGADGITKFSDSWMKLAKSGADLTGAFNEAMKDKEVKDWYMGKMAGASSTERDAFRQNVILNQLAKTYGVNNPATMPATDANYVAEGIKEGKTPAMQESPISPRGADTASDVNTKMQAAGIRVPDRHTFTETPGDVAANDVPVEVEFTKKPAPQQLAPQQPAPVEPRKKKPDEQAAMLYAGGYTPLKPRTRR